MGSGVKELKRRWAGGMGDRVPITTRRKFCGSAGKRFEHVWGFRRKRSRGCTATNRLKGLRGRCEHIKRGGAAEKKKRESMGKGRRARNWKKPCKKIQPPCPARLREGPIGEVRGEENWLIRKGQTKKEKKSPQKNLFAWNGLQRY